MLEAHPKWTAPSVKRSLELALAVGCVLPAEPAILVLFELVDRLLALVRRVVAVPALRAHEKHIAFFGLHLILLSKASSTRVRQKSSAKFASRAPRSEVERGRVWQEIIYSMILVTTPAPTVRPPSRIAKRSCSSIATGVRSSISSFTSSPGMHISAPSRRLAVPVTSVVRK